MKKTEQRGLVRWFPGVALSVFGALALNYTKVWDNDHHVEWALETGVPEPSPSMFYAGVLLCIVGGLLMGRASKGRG